MTISSIKVKVVRRPTLKLKVWPKFPSSVTAQSPILLDKAGGHFAFSLDLNALDSNINSVVDAAHPDLTAIEALTGTGIITRTGAGTAAVRTLTGTANQITITNGDGVAGNPTLSIPTSHFANPSASIGLAANNGTATTAMRSDGTPALSQSIAPTWTGKHTFTATAGGLSITGAPSSGITDNIFGGPTVEQYGSLSKLTAAYATNPEIGFASSLTSAVGAGNVAYYKVAAGFNARMNVGSSPAWAQTNVITVDSGVGDVQATGVEIDINNNNKNYTAAMGAAGHTLVNLELTGTATAGYGTAAIVMAYGASTTLPLWDFGILAGITGFKTFNTAFISDASNAPTSISINGTHTKGIDLSGSSCTFGIVFPNNQSALNQVTTGATVANLMHLDTANKIQIGDNTNSGVVLTAQAATSTPAVSVINTHATAGDQGIVIAAGTTGTADASTLYMSFNTSDNLNQAGSILRADAAGVRHVSYLTASDERLKKSLGSLADALDRVQKIEIHRYQGKDHVGADYDVGFFAQNLHEAFPWAVTPSSDPDYHKNPWQVDYGRVTPLLVAALQELVGRVESLQAEVDKLKKMP